MAPHQALRATLSHEGRGEIPRLALLATPFIKGVELSPP